MTKWSKMAWKLAAVLLLLHCVHALPEQGAYEVVMDQAKSIAVFTKSMHNNTSIKVKIMCASTAATQFQVKVEWLLRWTPCADEYVGIDEANGGQMASIYLQQPQVDLKSFGYARVKYERYEGLAMCGGAQDEPDGVPLQIIPDSPVELQVFTLRSKNKTATVVASKRAENSEQVEEKSRRRRQVEGSPKEQSVEAANPIEGAAPVESNPAPPPEGGEAAPTLAPLDLGTTSFPFGSSTPDYSFLRPDDFPFFMAKTPDNKEHEVTKTWETGVYVFIVRILPGTNTTGLDYTATLDVRMKGPYGYLSAIEWPLLPFYGTMCFIYVIFGMIWLFLSFCNWRDLLRIQFWIGGVILLGMLEKAVFFAEYESINTTGKSVRGALVMAELVSCLKRTLARMLVIIVSLGFGIVKPRLGPMLHRVLAMGGLYFVLSGVEGTLRILKTKSDQSNQLLLATIPLAVLDAAICWWIFTALVQTTRTLRLRRNLVKLSLYRHFTNTLIFAVLASVAFMVWSISQHRLAKCLKDWRELWVDDAFWHLLFSVILMVIVVLWRPNANNQRYAFSPLLDAADDEAVEPMMNDAFDGMKMRSKDGEKPRKDSKSKADDDLKWIEDNIPTSVTDTALPSLLDSDEEIMNTKYEMSKME